MAEETIVGAGEGSEEWALALYQGLDKSGNSLWSFDKNGNLTIKGALTSGSSTIGAGTAVNYAGDLAVNTNKFNVTATSGNTTVAGTLGVTGATTLAAVSATSGTFSGIVFETGIETPITAHAGGTQAAAFALNTSKPTHVVTTVGSSADSVKLPSATGSGAWHTISNQAATNSLQVYGSGTDTINAVATATGVAVAAGKTASFCDYAAGLWFGQAGA